MRRGEGSYGLCTEKIGKGPGQNRSLRERGRAESKEGQVAINPEEQGNLKRVGGSKTGVTDPAESSLPG